MTALSIRHLSVSFETADGGLLPAVRDISFSLESGSITCLVGESGCGKSLTAKACLRLLPANARTSGTIRLQETDILSLPERQMQAVRGRRMAMIFQEPMTALNPVLTAGFQAAEPLRHHLGLSKKEARAQVIELFRQVGIPSPEQRYDVYPHELSGGMRQRVMIATALACTPEVLLADEPTTALDPTIQGQILHIIQDLGRSRGMAVLLITHDLGVVAQVAATVGVMYAGRLVEFGSVADIFAAPAHPYTIGLMDSAPSRQAMHLSRLHAIPGTVPPLTAMPSGCPFSPRCSHATQECRDAFPPLNDLGSGHTVACFHRQ